MLSNYFTLKALVDEWAQWLPGSQIQECYSQSKGELSFSILSSGDEIHTLRINTLAPDRHMYSCKGQNRAKKNTVSIFSDAIDGSIITGLTIAESDRQISAALDSGLNVRVDLYGSQANIYLLGPDGKVLDRFRQVGTAPGNRPPEARSPDFPLSETDLEAKISNATGPLEKRIQRIISVFDRYLATEVVFRCDPVQIGKEPKKSLDYGMLFRTIGKLLAELEQPSPHIYNNSGGVITVSPVSLCSLGESEAESFPSMNTAVRLYVRKMHSRSTFDSQFRPLESALSRQFKKEVLRFEHMSQELSRPSRADQYERFGHLLMALQNDAPAGAEQVTLPDIIDASGSITIKLDARKNAVQNAERYYQKAKQTRAARQSAAARVDEAGRRVERLQDLINVLPSLESTVDVKRFKKENAEDLDRILTKHRKVRPSVPYRQFVLADNYEVWVGRSAAQNDELTMRVARKFDYWLHARGVAGSHVVLRVPIRDVRPPRSILEQAAAIAAFFSKAKTSSLVPVICTQKKFVRKPRKSLPGEVAVEREEVFMVEPILPVQHSERTI